jgi:hypothetical protein
MLQSMCCQVGHGYAPSWQKICWPQIYVCHEIYDDHKYAFVYVLSWNAWWPQIYVCHEMHDGHNTCLYMFITKYMMTIICVCICSSRNTQWPQIYVCHEISNTYHHWVGINSHEIGDEYVFSTKSWPKPIGWWNLTGGWGGPPPLMIFVNSIQILHKVCLTVGFFKNWHKLLQCQPWKKSSK